MHACGDERGMHLRLMTFRHMDVPVGRGSSEGSRQRSCDHSIGLEGRDRRVWDDQVGCAGILASMPVNRWVDRRSRRWNCLLLNYAIP